MYKTEWTHQPTPALNKQQQKLLNRELEHISEELESASDLIFHTVFLTEDMNSAIIMMDGREGYDDTVFLTYYETPEWFTLEDLKDDTD